MTNSMLLKSTIDQKGLSISYLADQMGMSRTTFYSRMNNSSTFDSEEISTLCKLLGIKSLKEKERIFFAVNVD